MTWINYKANLKLRWAKHCVLASASVKNDGDNSNQTIFTIKGTKPYVPVVTLSAKDNQNF